MRKFFTCLSVATLLNSGCATAIKAERVKVGDDQLTCGQLTAEIQEAEEFKKAAEDNKGVTATNAAAVLLFWPALIATYSDANEAIRAADERKANLARLYNTKDCGRYYYTFSEK